MWEIILDALKDSAIALPFLFLIYLFIEFLEGNERAKHKTVRLLNGKLAPIVAGGVGLIPQCGFSVMATDLYCQNYLKLGTLVAFFVATSDEALPIMLTNAKTVGIVWVVLLVKAVYAVALGYLINLFDRRTLSANYNLSETEGCCHHEFHHKHGDEEHDEELSTAETPVEHETSERSYTNVEAVEHTHCDSENAADVKHGKARAFWNFVKHPILHTVKIFLYIFAVNMIFGALLYFSHDAILDFAAEVGFFQCFVTSLLGLMPNCAGSVIITGMYTEGIVSFSALLAGLVSNSGIALAILFKQKNKWKRNLAIVGIMYFAGIALGIVGYFVCPLVGLV